MDILKKLWTKSEQYLKWYCGLSGLRFASAQRDCMYHIFILQQTAMTASEADQQWGAQKMKELESLVNLYQGKGGRFQDE